MPDAVGDELVHHGRPVFQEVRFAGTEGGDGVRRREIADEGHPRRVEAVAAQDRRNQKPRRGGPPDGNILPPTRTAPPERGGGARRQRQEPVTTVSPEQRKEARP